MGIRNLYKNNKGVQNYYTKNVFNYVNPHFRYIYEIINNIIDDKELDLSKCLDMSCGNGEITSILVKKGVMDIESTDPYMCKSYNKKYSYPCYEYSFDDILNGKLDNKRYSTIFCSYALHLSDKSKIPNILWRLSLISKYMVIISPNNTEYKNIGWDIIDQGKEGKSRFKILKSNNYE